MDSLEPHQLYTIMSDMKQLATQQPDQVRALLAEQPQLSLALLRAQLRMRMIEPEFAQQLLLEASRNLPPPPPQAAQPAGFEISKKKKKSFQKVNETFIFVVN